MAENKSRTLFNESFESSDLIVARANRSRESKKRKHRSRCDSPGNYNESKQKKFKETESGIVTEVKFQRNLTKKFSKKVTSLNSSMEGKHCISFLYELCAKKKWGMPKFEVLNEYGPCHRKTFIMTVNVNGQQYTSSRCVTKKIAKLEAANACLKALGKYPSVSSEPLLLDDKRGKRGIVTEEEYQRNLAKRFSEKVTPLISTLEGKHCISFIYEFCAKKKLGIPKFEVLDESGRCHRKTFIMTVNINGQQYTSSRCVTKKIAKLEAAKACLRAIGVPI